MPCGVVPAKKARTNRDAHEEEDTIAADIRKIHEELGDVRDSLHKVEASITETEKNLKVMPWHNSFNIYI
jgi:peptidoglycan hydrolase CwlO-like protein